jgi:phosphatidate cytidylyltransferase
MGVMIAAGIGIGIVAVLGDLLESYSKRHFAVKDTGGLIPGHGGLFDRVDSLLVAALAVALLQLIATQLGRN